MMTAMQELSKVSGYLAKNIEKLRRQKNLSQQKFAELAGIPRSTLTNIESGIGNPSLTNLVKISVGLGVSIEELLSRPRTDCVLIKAQQILVQNRSGGHVRVHHLMPDNIKGLEIDRLEFDAEAVMGGQPHLPGTKEYLTVLQGEVMVYVAGETFAVSKGDLLAFSGDQAHSYRNATRSKSIALSIVIPVPASL